MFSLVNVDPGIPFHTVRARSDCTRGRTTCHGGPPEPFQIAIARFIRLSEKYIITLYMEFGICQAIGHHQSSLMLMDAEGLSLPVVVIECKRRSLHGRRRSVDIRAHHGFLSYDLNCEFFEIRPG